MWFCGHETHIRKFYGNKVATHKNLFFVPGRNWFPGPRDSCGLWPAECKQFDSRWFDSPILPNRPLCPGECPHQGKDLWTAYSSVYKQVGRRDYGRWGYIILSLIVFLRATRGHFMRLLWGRNNTSAKTDAEFVIKSVQEFLPVFLKHRNIFCLS